MFKLKYFCFAVIICGMISCQNLNVGAVKADCSQLDWYEIGRADAAQGQPSLSWEERQKSCLNFDDANHERYLTGWNGGIHDYCTREHGFFVGRAGQSYSQVCPPSLERDFLSGYKLGQKIYSYERDNRQLSEELDKISKATNKSQADGKMTSEALSRINQLETRMELNRAMISELQSELGQISRQ